jgi:hypothetical protein
MWWGHGPPALGTRWWWAHFEPVPGDSDPRHPVGHLTGTDPRNSQSQPVSCDVKAYQDGVEGCIFPCAFEAAIFRRAPGVRVSLAAVDRTRRGTPSGRRCMSPALTARRAGDRSPRVRQPEEASETPPVGVGRPVRLRVLARRHRIETTWPYVGAGARQRPGRMRATCAGSRLRVRRLRTLDRCPARNVAPVQNARRVALQI